MNDILYWIWLSIKCTPGTDLGDKLLAAFDKSAKTIYEATEEDYQKIDSLKPGIIEELCDKDITESNDIYEYCRSNDIGLLAYNDELYPERLRRIAKAPILLYYRGNFQNLNNCVCIATVGTRRMTQYGKREGYKISHDLAKAGIITVSGLARGVDTVCHRGTIDGGGRTIAVLGCGINVVYPPENKALMDEIIYYGTVITEYRPNTRPLGQNFPIRNRIISGLCQGTLIVEADNSSGAMITARYALSQGRDIYALPGKVGELNSLGPNQLIQNGAKMVTKASDIVMEYEFLYPNRLNIKSLPEFKPKIYFKKPKKIAPENQNLLFDDEGKLLKGQKVKFNVPEPAKEKTQAKSSEEKIAITQKLPELSAEEQLVYDYMPKETAITVDEITRHGVAAGTVLAAMTFLEIKGYVAALPGGKYIRR